MKVRKSAVTSWIVVLLGMVIVSGCSPVTVETPHPATASHATQTAIALAQLEVELKQTQTALAATQTAMSFTATPTALLTVVYCTDNGSGGTETIPVEPPRTVDQIRIDLEERATDCGFSLWEAEAYGPDTGDTNLAIGATPTASSSQNSYGCYGCFPVKAIDGDMNTRWSSDWRDGQWLEIALPAPQIVNRIVLEWEEAYASKYCVTVIEP